MINIFEIQKKEHDSALKNGATEDYCLGIYAGVRIGYNHTMLLCQLLEKERDDIIRELNKANIKIKKLKQKNILAK